jgi:hypothetical protein
MKKTWEEKLEEILENHDDVFGHNTEVDIHRFMRGLKKSRSHM